MVKMEIYRDGDVVGTISLRNEQEAEAITAALVDNYDDYVVAYRAEKTY